MLVSQTNWKYSVHGSFFLLLRRPILATGEEYYSFKAFAHNMLNRIASRNPESLALAKTLWKCWLVYNKHQSNLVTLGTTSHFYSPGGSSNCILWPGFDPQISPLPGEKCVAIGVIASAARSHGQGKAADWLSLWSVVYSRCSARLCRTSVGQTVCRSTRGRPSSKAAMWSACHRPAKPRPTCCRCSSHCSPTAVTANCRDTESGSVVLTPVHATSNWVG